MDSFKRLAYCNVCLFAGVSTKAGKGARCTMAKSGGENFWMTMMLLLSL